MRVCCSFGPTWRAAGGVQIVGGSHRLRGMPLPTRHCVLMPVPLLVQVHGQGEIVSVHGCIILFEESRSLTRYRVTFRYWRVSDNRVRFRTIELRHRAAVRRTGGA